MHFGNPPMGTTFMNTIKGMQKLKIIVFFVLWVFFPSIIFVPPVNAEHWKNEIDHLLDFIRHSGCMFIRNDTLHEPPQAVEHIVNKYRHFREKIDSTEDFIELCATKSTLSGRFYEVSCPGKPKIRTRDWLLEELARYRQGGSGQR